MKRKSQYQSQAIELFFTVAEALGLEGDAAIAQLADMSVENVSNWRNGSVRELKTGTLSSVKRGLEARIRALREQAEHHRVSGSGGLSAIEVEACASPGEVQRQLRERIQYDYIGHGFLYFEPQGALAWERLTASGYEQDRWLRGVAECADQWLSTGGEGRGKSKGALAASLGLGRSGSPRGLDVISLGPGEGSKEARLLEHLCAFDARERGPLPWLTVSLVDVSIPLLLRAAGGAREVLARDGTHAHYVLPFCADFEEGPLSFTERLPSASRSDARRLVLVLGNVFGNLRDEELFVRRQLSRLLRPGDMLWLEVGVRPAPVSLDPLFKMTTEDHEESAAEANRRLLLEGPYRRWQAALGRRPGSLRIRIRLREDDESSRVPGSCNFCHDLILEDEGRACTMLYSRRYDVDALVRWLAPLGYSCESIVRLDKGQGTQVAHLLLQRRE